ncbi:unnamed protein product [Leptosia nina]|uniref:C2H2-type domain-containing protein n=1 Tax=Leptosia nina TaxID=320188 RepID=A0AAV1JUC6_9NEOP
MSGRVVVARRGVQRDCCSACFTFEELESAMDTLHTPENVYMELDSAGQLTCRGGCARAAVRATLAASLPAAQLLLEVVNGNLRLRVVNEAPPHAELTLWFDETTLAILDMPFLTLRNITGNKKSYSCHECGAVFDNPNPVKVHLFLKCGEYNAVLFWRKLLKLLRKSSATWDRVSPGVDIKTWALPPGPAELETIAAAWGRAREGHICVYCGKMYSRKYGLKIHIRTHTGYKPLRCRHCARAFADPSNLNKHVRLHAASSRTRTRVYNPS